MALLHLMLFSVAFAWTAAACNIGSEFTCQSNGLCIPSAWHCDGNRDCLDFSDENECTDIFCPSDMFKCRPGYCIPLQWKCDGQLDCIDGSDESNDTCAESVQIPCSENQFTCPGVEPICIPNAWICDHEPDCNDGADEVGCPTPTCDEARFQCTSSKECILKRWLCDGDSDCRDDSDESPETCPNLMTTSLPCPSGTGEGSGCQEACIWPNAFQCPNDPACVQISGVCDGIDDCTNGEDEIECTPQPCSEDNGGCGDRQCVVVPNGYFCECGMGYQFTVYGCEDINECEQSPSPCPGIDCIDLQPGFTCSCPDPRYYLAPDGRTCQFTFPTRAVLLTGSRGKILELDVLLGGVEVYADGFENVVSVAYDPKTESVYASDSVLDDIKRINQSDGGISEQVITHDTTASGMAFDWINSNLYWADDDKDAINVASWDGRYKKTLISQGLDKPRAIAVDPKSQYMYWSDCGDTPYIGRAYLNGQSVVHLISDNLGCVNGLALDYEGQRLYWIDARFCRLESSDLSGNDRRVILEFSCNDEETANHLNGVAVFQDTLYWTSGVGSSVYAANKFNGEGLERLFDVSDTPVSLILKTDEYYYDGINCFSRNGYLCTHLCLDSPSLNGPCACPDNAILAVDKITCLCSNGNRLADDGVTCVEENFCKVTPDPCPGIDCVSTQTEATCVCPGTEYILVENKKGTTCVFSYPTPPDILLANGRFVRVIDALFRTLKTTISGFTTATVVAYDWLYRKEAMYVSDTSKGTITRIDHAGNVVGNRTVIVSGTASVLGLAFDDVHRYLYWSDSRKGTISVTPWDGGYSKVILSRDEGTSVPRALAVDPRHGYLYWTDYSQRNTFIGRAGLDGSNPEQIVTEDLQWPISLVYDPSQDKLYWLDLGSRTIYSSKTDGSRRHLLISEMSRRPFGLAVHQDRVYWTDGSKGSLLSANKFSGMDLQVVVEGLRRPMGIVSTEAGSTTIANAFEEAGNICSHFCLGTPTTTNPRGFTCACPGDYSRVVGSDLNQCVCLNGTLLLPDGVTCETQTTNCPPGEFQCRSDGRCIPLQQTCNGNVDCADGSDEECEGSTQDWCSMTDPIPCPGVDCLNMPSRPRCVCPEYFGLDVDGRTCLRAYPTKPVLLVAGQDSLLLVDMLTPTLADAITDIHVEGAWMDLYSVAYDFKSRYMFVGDIGKGTIERYTATGLSFGSDFKLNNRTVLSTTANSTEGMSYDWLHGNLYWVDTSNKSIKVVRHDGRWPPSVVLGGLDKPRGIVVNPAERYMYYTDWGVSPMIGKAGLDGSDPSALVDSDIIWPNGLALDYQASRLYWVDSMFDRMEYIGLDGRGRRIVIENENTMRRPLGIGIYEDRVYWGDWNTKSLSSANKFTGERIKTVPLGKAPMFISVGEDHEFYFGPDVSNHCSFNHGCSHLCLPSPTNFTCTCPQTAYLDTDNSTCLCHDGRPLLKDGASCEEKLDKDPLPVRVQGLTGQYLEDKDQSFDLRCTIINEEVVCVPK